MSSQPVVRTGKGAFDHQQPAVRRDGSAARPQDRDGVGVLPVVQDELQDMDVAVRYGVEEACRDRNAALADPGLAEHLGGGGHHVRLVDQRAGHPRVTRDEPRQQGAVAAAHVDDPRSPAKS